MIAFPSARHKSFRLPPHTEFAALDKERSFLMRVVRLSKAKTAPQTDDPSNRIGKQK